MIREPTTVSMSPSSAALLASNYDELITPLRSTFFKRLPTVSQPPPVRLRCQCFRRRRLDRFFLTLSYREPRASLHSYTQFSPHVCRQSGRFQCLSRVQAAFSRYGKPFELLHYPGATVKKKSNDGRHYGTASRSQYRFYFLICVSITDSLALRLHQLLLRVLIRLQFLPI